MTLFTLVHVIISVGSVLPDNFNLIFGIVRPTAHTTTTNEMASRGGEYIRGGYHSPKREESDDGSFIDDEEKILEGEDLFLDGSLLSHRLRSNHFAQRLLSKFNATFTRQDERLERAEIDSKRDIEMEEEEDTSL